MKECEFKVFQAKVLDLAFHLIADNPFLRLGQAVFIVMSNKCKSKVTDIVKEIVGDAEKDPFYNDANIVRFWNYLRERLNVE